MMKRRTMLSVLAGATLTTMLSRQLEAKSMTATEANKRLIQNLIEEVWREGRIDALPMFWAANCVNHADTSPENKGLAAVRLYHEGFASWFRDFDDVIIEVQQQVAEGDRVVTQMFLRAMHRVKRRKVSLATIRIDRVEHGKIAEHWSIADMAGLAQQLA